MIDFNKYNLARQATKREVHSGHMIGSTVLKKGDIIMRDGSKTIKKDVGSPINRYMETYVTEKVISKKEFEEVFGKSLKEMEEDFIFLADMLIGDRRVNDENELPNSAFKNVKKGY